MTEEPLAPGTILGGRYRVDKLLGEGGMGAVYEGEQTGLGRRVAIKLLHKSLAFHPDSITRFKREAQAAASLGHPNIVLMIDFQTPENEAPFLVMELLAGRSLATAIRAEGQLEGLRVMKIARQIANALEAAHAAGIVHRDIKPDNIFLVDVPGTGEFVKVLDFGIAKLEAPSDGVRTSTGTMLGSPAFMAPEQARGSDVDARADIFALGSTMYRALSGKLPFDAASMNALLFAVTEQTPTPLAELVPGIDPRCVKVVERAMQKDRDARYQSAADMRVALDAMTSHEAFADTIASVPPVPTPKSPSSESIPPPSAKITTTAATAPTEIAMPTSASSGESSTSTRENRPPIARGLAVAALLLAVAYVAWGNKHATDAATPIVASPSSAIAIASALSAAPIHEEPSAIAVVSAPIEITSAAAKKPPNLAPKSVHSTSESFAGAATTFGTAVEGPPPVPLSAMMSGRTPVFSGGAFGAYDIAATRAAIARRWNAVTACYVAQLATPPDHQFSVYRFRVDANGTIAEFLGGPDGATAPRIDALDRCVARALIGMSLGPSPTGKADDLVFNISARKPNNP